MRALIVADREAGYLYLRLDGGRTIGIPINGSAEAHAEGIETLAAAAIEAEGKAKAEAMAQRGQRAAAAIGRRPSCSWPGCESKAAYPVAIHEGPHPDDEFAEAWCPFHEVELTTIANADAQVLAELIPVPKLLMAVIYDGADPLATIAEARLHQVWQAEARGHLEDCFGDEVPADLTDDEVEAAIGRHYEGGVAAFTRDIAELLAEGGQR